MIVRNVRETANKIVTGMVNVIEYQINIYVSRIQETWFKKNHLECMCVNSCLSANATKEVQVT